MMKKVLASIMSLFLCFTFWGVTSAAGYTYFDYEEDEVRAGKTLGFSKKMNRSGTVEIFAIQHHLK
ncbi:hypothetical protein [Bacillus wiedmannii]|uniref:hypothetical protein n=1 Tax=Bacillus wiedmannii TaxID=1890302 RepID=UPI001F4F47F0|nr:hypothetical protein [Bacillus wiedmannii]